MNNISIYRNIDYPLMAEVKGLTEKNPDLITKLRELVEPSTAGNPQSSIIWVSKSLRHLETEMNASGYAISYAKIGNILHDEGFNLKGNKKTREGKSQLCVDMSTVYSTYLKREYPRIYQNA